MENFRIDTDVKSMIRKGLNVLNGKTAKNGCQDFLLQQSNVPW